MDNEDEAIFSEVEEAWEREIEHRIQTIDTGAATGRPFADVLRDINRKLLG
jgi:hypothetical protein